MVLGWFCAYTIFIWTASASCKRCEPTRYRESASLPKEFALHNNYPNPFNPVTNITYDIPEATDVTLEIYNVMGQRVRTLAQGNHEPGRYQIVWSATNDIGQYYHLECISIVYKQVIS